jgi:hypothetical protein
MAAYFLETIVVFASILFERIRVSVACQPFPSNVIIALSQRRENISDSPMDVAWVVSYTRLQAANNPQHQGASHGKRPLDELAHLSY